MRDFAKAALWPLVFGVWAGVALVWVKLGGNIAIASDTAVAFWYALALGFTAWVALDLGRRWIAHQAVRVRADEAVTALQAKADTHDKAIANMARQWAEALAKEQARTTAIEAKLTAGDVTRSAQAGNWRR